MCDYCPIDVVVIVVVVVIDSVVLFRLLLS